MDPKLLINSEFGAAFENKSVLEAFATQFALHRYGAGETIIAEDAPQERAFVVSEGSVLRRKRQGSEWLLIDVLGPGATAGFHHVIQKDKVAMLACLLVCQRHFALGGDWLTDTCSLTIWQRGVRMVGDLVQ